MSLTPLARAVITSRALGYRDGGSCLACCRLSYGTIPSVTSTVSFALTKIRMRTSTVSMRQVRMCYCVVLYSSRKASRNVVGCYTTL